jgi:hypothetical protein
MTMKGAEECVPRGVSTFTESCPIRIRYDRGVLGILSTACLEFWEAPQQRQATSGYMTGRQMRSALGRCHHELMFV